MILDKPRIIILSTVPVTMLLTLVGLHSFFGTKVATAINSGYKKISQTSEMPFQYKTRIPATVKNKRRVKVVKFPPPAAHTFVGFEFGSAETEKTNIKNQGVILK